MNFAYICCRRNAHFSAPIRLFTSRGALLQIAYTVKEPYAQQVEIQKLSESSKAAALIRRTC